MNRAPWPYLLPVNDVQVDPACEETSQLIREWLKECQTSHELCNQHSEGSQFVPKRLLDIRSGAYEDGVRLVHTESSVPYLRKERSPRYIALSHCWGRSPMYKTEQASLQCRMQRIPILDLPKTFQDAITVCRNIGFRYIWVDSLCIIQDSSDDWEEQSAQMGEIYAHASLTIAASSGEDSSAGFLQPRSKHISHLLQFPRPRKWFSDASVLKVRRKLPNRVGDQDPLYARAWVYQERMLASCLISFGSDELLWECKEMTRCECSNHDESINTSIASLDGNAAHSISFFRNEKNADKLYDTAVTDRGAGRDYVLDYWRTVVVPQYTNRQLTYESDILPALSGIAKKISASLNVGSEDYLAGLWKIDIPVSLCWVTTSVQSQPRTEYHAPSWSWASVKGDVEFIKHVGTTMHATILEAACTRSNHAPFSAVSDAVLRLRAPMLRGRLLIQTSLKGRNIRSPTRYDIRWPDMTTEAIKALNNSIYTDLINTASANVDFTGTSSFAVDAPLVLSPTNGDLMRSDTEETDSSGFLTGGVWICCLTECITRAKERSWHFILLVESASKRGCLERIGMMRTDNEELGLAILQAAHMEDRSLV